MFLLFLFLFLHRLSNFPETFQYEVIYGPFRICTLIADLSSFHTGQYLQSLFDLVNGIYNEPAVLHCIDHFLPEHEVFNISPRNYHAVAPVQSPVLTEVKKAFDLLVNAADRLHIPGLVHGAGHCKTLLQRDACYAAEQRIEFCAGGAVSLYHLIELLKGDGSREADGFSGRIFASKIAGYYHDRLLVDLPAHLRFTLYIYHPCLPYI